MGNVLYNPPKHYGRKAAAEYADYYESEEETFKNFWKRVRTSMKARYKILIDKNARQRHKTKMVRSQLRQVGLHGFDLLKPEAFYVANLLKPKEKVAAAVCGRVKSGSSVFLILTDARFLYLDIIPLFTTIEEIGFGIIEAVSLGIGQFDATVCLYTGVGNFTLRGVGLDAASKFVSEVEALIEKNQLAMVGR